MPTPDASTEIDYRLPPEMMRAGLISLRSLTARLMPNDLPKPARPWSARSEIKVIRQAVIELLAGSPVGVIERLIEAASGDPRMDGIPKPIRLAELSIYADAKERRGRGTPDPSTAGEDSDAKFAAIRFVVGSLLASLPDEQLIGANRAAYGTFLALPAASADPAVRRQRQALEIEMALLGDIMDANGATARFRAANNIPLDS